jgi:hypothetical protein
MSANRPSIHVGLWPCTAPVTWTAAARKLRQTMLSNLYLVPHLLGAEQAELNIWHGSNIRACSQGRIPGAYKQAGAWHIPMPGLQYWVITPNIASPAQKISQKEETPGSNGPATLSRGFIRSSLRRP